MMTITMWREVKDLGYIEANHDTEHIYLRLMTKIYPTHGIG